MKNVLIRKSLRDIFRQIKQYLAVILIAAVSVCLFAGLAANYHVLKARKDRLYKDCNISDLFVTVNPSVTKNGRFESITEEDVSKIENLEDFKGELEIEKRLVLPVDFYPENAVIQESSDDKTEVSGARLLHLNNLKENKQNKILGIYNENREPILDQNKNIKTFNGANGVYLPMKALASSFKVGQDLNTKFSTSVIFSNIKKKLGIKLEKENGKNTGRFLDDKTNNILKFKHILEKLDAEKRSKLAFFLSYFGISTNDEISKDTVKKFGAFLSTYLKSKDKDPFGEKRYLELLDKLDNPNHVISFKVKLLGYVVQPESIDANPRIPIAFGDYKFFLNKIKEELKTIFKGELSLLKMIYSIIDKDSDFSKGYDEYFKDIYNQEYKEKLEQISAIIPSKQKDEIKKNIKDAKTNFLYNINKVGLYNQYNIRLKDYRKVEKLKKEIENIYSEKLKEDENSARIFLNLTKDEIYSAVVINSDIKQAYQLMLIFPIIFFIVAFLVIIATSLQIVLRERTQIGTLKAIGYSNFRIYNHYIGRTIIICFIGIVLGVVTGPFILPVILNNKYNLLYTLPKLQFVFPYLEVIILMVVFLSLLSFTMFLVCRHEVKMLPSKSMRPKTIKFNFKPNERVSKKHISKKIAFRNIKVNVFRSFMAILGVMGCCALVISGMGISDTIHYGIDKDIKKYYNCDIVVTYNHGSNPIEELKKVKGVDPNMVENYFLRPAKIINLNNNKTQDSHAIAFLDDSKFIGNEYKTPQPGYCFIPKNMARQLGIKKGDDVKFKTLENIEKTFKVQELVKTFLVQGIIFSLSDPSVSDIKNSAFGCYLKVLPEYSDKIAEVESEIRKVENVSFTVTNKRVESVIRDVSSSINNLTITILIFAILLSATVLYNLSRLNINERKREIATLKVLGFSSLEITESILIETIFLTVIGSILGALLGFPMLYIILRINETPIISYIYYISWQTYVIGAFSSVIVGFFINFYMSKITRKIKMIESLKAVE